MARLRDLSPSEANFSLLCQDLSQVSQYVAPLPQPVFKLMKRALPGPFTFILNAGVKVPRIFRKSKKEVGIRIPDHAVPKALIEAIGRPFVVSSVHHDDEAIEYMTDPGPGPREIQRPGGRGGWRRARPPRGLHGHRLHLGRA